MSLPFKPFKPSGISHYYQLNRSILYGGTLHFYSNFDYSGDPDQMPRSVAPDPDLHCLPMSDKNDARLIWGKNNRECTDSHFHHKYIAKGNN